MRLKEKIRAKLRNYNILAEQESDELIQGKLYQLKLRKNLYANTPHIKDTALGYTFRLAHSPTGRTVEDILSARKKIMIATKQNQHVRNSGDLFKPLNKAIFGLDAKTNIYYPFDEPVLLWDCRILSNTLERVERQIDLYIRGNLYKNIDFIVPDNFVKFVRIGKEEETD